jgi:hypothetical protein
VPDASWSLRFRISPLQDLAVVRHEQHVVRGYASELPTSQRPLVVILCCLPRSDGAETEHGALVVVSLRTDARLASCTVPSIGREVGAPRALPACA